MEIGTPRNPENASHPFWFESKVFNEEHPGPGRYKCLLCNKVLSLFAKDGVARTRYYAYEHVLTQHIRVSVTHMRATQQIIQVIFSKVNC